MNIFESLILGVIQGITEFLPISSSGHLVICQQLLGLKEPELLFDIMLHLGTLVATALIFYKEIFKMLTSLRAILLIGVALIPAAIAGFTFLDAIEKSFGSMRIAAIGLLITSVWLWITRFVRQKPLELDGFLFSDMTFPKAFLIGVAQSIALIPGISRSGSTIATALLLKVPRRDAVAFSFLLSIPAVAGAAALKLLKTPHFDLGQLPLFITGATTSCLIGIGALLFLIRWVQQGNLFKFSYYCLLVGSGALALSYYLK